MNITKSLYNYVIEDIIGRHTHDLRYDYSILLVIKVTLIQLSIHGTLTTTYI